MKSFESSNFLQEPSEQPRPYDVADLEKYASTLGTELEDEIKKLEGGTEITNGLEIVDRFRKKVAEEIKIAVLATALLAPQAHGANIENIQETIDSPESYEYKVQERVSELKEKVLHDSKETYYILLGRHNNLQEITKIKGNENSTFVSQTEDELVDAGTKATQMLAIENTPFKNIMGYFTNNPITRVTIHNHPYGVVQEELSISKEDVEQMRSSEKAPAVLPPSGIDLLSSITTSTEKVDSIGYVVEPSGTWKYDIEESDPNVIKMRDLKRQNMYDLQSAVRDYFYLKPELAEKMRQETKDLQFDQYYEYYEEHHPELAKTLLTVYEGLQQRLTEDLDKDFVSAGIQIDTLSDSIRTKSLAGEDTSELIGDYVNTATQIGFYIEYTGNDGTRIIPKHEEENSSNEK